MNAHRTIIERDPLPGYPEYPDTVLGDGEAHDDVEDGIACLGFLVAAVAMAIIFGTIILGWICALKGQPHP